MSRQKSLIGWIDFSSTERERVSQVLSMLQEKGTLDELGIGQIRDAFADQLFPGFSTIQTRAKYFVTIPYIFHDYRKLEPNERPLLAEYISQQEDKLAICLVENHQHDMLICSSQTGHLTKRHFVFHSSLGLGTQEHCAFSFDYNQPQCTRRSFDASALSS